MPRCSYNPSVQPPSSPLDLGEPLYEAFYGLREQPFALSTDPRFLFLSASHRRAYDELLTGLRRREGLLLLTGETGTGKTTLCRAVIDALGHRTFSALILNPYMSDTEVLRVVLRDFGLVSRDEIRRGAFAKADTPQLLDTLEGFLRSLLPLNSYAVLIIDEAQSLTPQVLDRVRMLGSFEQDGHRLLQIVLVGQPGLADTIKAESMRALNERITRRTTLTPLSQTEVADYIEHRLAIAGGRDRVRFLPEAVALIADLSRGLPRRVNLLCDRTLEEGRVSGKTAIGPDLVRRAAKAVAGAHEPAETTRPSAAAEPESVEPVEREFTLTLGQQPAAAGSGRLWIVIGLMLVLLAGVVGAGGYAWKIVSTDPGLPPPPRPPALKIGAPPLPIAMPNEEEIKAGLTALRNAPSGIQN